MTFGLTAQLDPVLRAALAAPKHVSVAQERKPLIDGRGEAVLCVGWYCIAIAGALVGNLVTPWGWALFLLIPLDIWLMFRRLTQRLDISHENRRILRFWLGSRAQYQAWRVLFGRQTA